MHSRSLLDLLVLLAVLVLSVSALPVRAVSKATLSKGIELLKYDIKSQDLVFSLPCAGCILSVDAATQADLVFKLRHLSRPDAATCGIVAVVNDGPVDLCYQRDPHGVYTAERSLEIAAIDNASHLHAVTLNVTGHGIPLDANSDLSIFESKSSFDILIHSVDGVEVPHPRGFSIRWSEGQVARLLDVSLMQDPARMDFASMTKSFDRSRESLDMTSSMAEDEMSDIESDLETLRLLEADASQLQSELEAAQKAVKARIKQHTSKMPLKHLLEQCDGIMCAVRVVSERLCDKLDMSTQSLHKYVQVNAQTQRLATLPDASEKPPQTARNFTKFGLPSYGVINPLHASDKVQAAALPVIITQDSSQNASFNWRDQLKPQTQSTLVRVLELIAALIGLTTLCTYIRRKCMSMRRRVERAADREERRNARAYRRAARRATMRKRWSGLVATLSYFSGESTKPTRIEDYEEKRALILQDAFLEQSLDQAEKGEVMEAEIRELRHAHEIVAGLVRVGEDRRDLMRAPRWDPPPQMVPLPEARSRASTATLPSYTSESLPDYASTPDEAESGGTANGFARYAPASESEDGCPSLVTASEGSTSGSLVTRYTPVSSVAAISVRYSEETLRTVGTGGTGE
ncbi:hypothetical protein B0A48_11770 [Cryoendolithus antarcticus]|uniref:Uncharacterized protein n=1 Tax=Cryoendolithus antarcticus TaxID=1507870 RepID=A0A1V8SSU6_9PEZI|nr:hypothetical protein B0A48_11770 [Cryoendolithus antarcticus]